MTEAISTPAPTPKPKVAEAKATVHEEEHVMPEATTTAKPRYERKVADLSAAAFREDLIGTLKQAQQLTLDAVTTWVDVVSRFGPRFPLLPFTPARPQVVEGVALFFDLTEELLSTERKFASELVNVLVPA